MYLFVLSFGQALFKNVGRDGNIHSRAPEFHSRSRWRKYAIQTFVDKKMKMCHVHPLLEDTIFKKTIQEMSIMQHINFSVVTVVISILLSSGIGRAELKNMSATQIVDKVQSFYEGIDDYKARFVQTTAHKMFPGKFQRAYGTVMFKKGGLMRWEYTRPEKKLFIYDGMILWVYEPEVPQIFKGQGGTERLRKALAFLTGEGKIKDSYKASKADIKKYDFKDGYVLKLVPKEANSPFKHVEMYVMGDTFRVARSVVVDHDDNRNRLDFYSPEVNAGLDARLFQFEPPAGVPVMTPQNQ
ncbi:MAG: outer membrane lipoprotein chaperone LolA [Deltaproteobacteria bacterium]|nr:outer membrane lipoprotein chaperone LolA [Deltaproteobacteria bacterium]